MHFNLNVFYFKSSESSSDEGQDGIKLKKKSDPSTNSNRPISAAINNTLKLRYCEVCQVEVWAAHHRT